MKTKFTAEYVDLSSDRPFPAVIAAFESATGNFEDEGPRMAALTAHSIESFEAQVHAQESTSGFMRFLTTDHGGWMRKFEAATLQARMYVIGNPLIARTMLRHSMAAGLNVPVRIYIFEDDAKKTHFAWHTPSSLMSVYNNPDVMQACKPLDEKLAHLAATVLGLPTDPA
jgi:uncharacterized protein (DUF302 family)